MSFGKLLLSELSIVNLTFGELSFEKLFLSERDRLSYELRAGALV